MRAILEFLLCGSSPNGIRFLKSHHLNEEITAARGETVVQRGLTLASSFVARQDSGLVQTVTKAQLE